MMHSRAACSFGLLTVSLWLSIATGARAQSAAASGATKPQPVQTASAASAPHQPPAATNAGPQPTAAGASAVAAANANVEKAREHFQRGIDSYRDGDLATALIEFKRAYSTAPNYRLLYNLGQVSAELRDYPSAERYLMQYLEQSQGAIDDTRRDAVRAELAKVRSRIAFLHLSSNVDGTELLVDDIVVGRTPLTEPIHVSTGRRRITGRAPGHAPVTQVIDAAGGEDVSLNLHLQPIPSLSHEEAPGPSVVTEPSGTRKPWLLGLAIGAGVLTASGAVFAYLAQNDASEYRSALGRKTNAVELQELADGARTKALVTDFLFGAALLSATVGAVVLLSPDASSREHASLRVGIGHIELAQHF